MRTYKRRIADIDTSVNNISKFDNQLTFTGIKLDKNIYNVDQKSQTDALNVYVEDEQLKSRDPLLEAPLGISLNENDVLLDIKEANDVKVYVVQNGTLITVTAKRDNLTASITCNTNYHIAIYNQYIICFRNEGAMLIDTTATNFMWRSLNSQIEIPVAKVTTGSYTVDKDINQFTDEYIHRYIRTDELATALPEVEELDYYNAPISARIITKNGTHEYDVGSPISKPWILPEYRYLSELSITPAGLSNGIKDEVLAAKNVIIIARASSFLVSFDYGRTFSQVLYPKVFIRSKDNTQKFASDLKAISDDGQNFFYCTDSGVYRCSLADYTWTRFTFHNLNDSELESRNMNGLGLSKTANCEFSQQYHFKNAEVFCFKVDKYICFKAPYMTNDITNNANTLCTMEDPAYVDYTHYQRSHKTILNQSIKIDVNKQGIGYLAYTSYDVLLSKREIQFVAIYGRSDREVYIYAGNAGGLSLQWRAPGAVTINDLQYLTNYNATTPIAIKISGIIAPFITDDINYDGAFEYTYVFGHDNNGASNVDNNLDKFEVGFELSRENDIGIPIRLSDSLYVSYGIGAPVLIDTIKLREQVGKYGEYAYISLSEYTYEIYAPDMLTYDDILIADNIIYFVKNSNYSSSDNRILTTKLAPDEIIEVDYHINRNSNNVYSKVPNLSYSGSELYLVFDNELAITKNIKDGSNIKFSLPKINNQAFANKITNLINISTSELALFFNNDIIICTKSENETFGIVYSYNKTRLSLGVRAGDDVINTLDGAASLLPTIRGLALMNYQAYMATSDQVLSFISDDISDIWKEFYNNGKNIKMTQMKNFVFITNQTKDYLMLDMKTLSWWKFRVPVAITKFNTDQNTLNVISKQYYVFDANYNRNKYFDFDGSRIDWRIVSQRLHFGLPNHYKNLKQLIFQLMQTNEFKNTILTQIKLYRKVVTYKEPEIVNFKIDEYRTFVKRFNYWKINEVQWGLSNDRDTAIPAQLVLNGIDIKYEIGEEVR